MNRLTLYGVTIKLEHALGTDGRSVVHSPELGVSADGASPADAMTALSRRIDALLCERGACGASAWAAG